MKGARGIDNPAFVPSSPDTPRRSSASPSQVEVSHAPTEDAQPPKPPEPPLLPPAEPESLALSQFKEGSFGWGRFTPRSLRRCNTPAGFLLHYCVLAVTQGTCLARNSTSCAPSRSLLSNYLYVFILGQLLLGVGEPLSTPWARPSLMSLYPHTKLLSTLTELTFAFSFLSCSIDVTKDDPQWLGAWWIGFLVSWLFAWSLIIPFSCFPKHLPGTAKVQAEKTSQTHQCKRSSLSRVDQNFGQNIKDFPVALKNLMRNTVFICTSSEALITTGFAIFLPKFIENQFGLTSSFAATIRGAVLIPGAALGQILGGAVVSRYKMTCKYAMKFALVTSGVALVLTFLLICAKCENEPFAGVSESYNGIGDLGNLTAPCNTNCNCLRSYYYPLCGRDGVQYFSPCFAGCLNYVSNSKPKRYYNCSCIEKKAEITSTESVNFEAKAGKCETHCTNLPVFLGMFFVTVIYTFMAGTRITVSILRCVDQRQRSLALGTQFMLLRLLGTIPGPIIFGATIDSTCTLWDINECGIKGACWVYGNIKMAHMLVAISVTCKIITIFFNGLAVFLYKSPPPGTEVSFQNQNADVTAVSIEQALNKGVNDG
ncbi:solute carrier organic anion transporter family member 4C1-like [Cavia porcellus]|uniref:solute carrier organic anion transporter family member 4C1-like n=1 Tax=Cavia porcellus TaxID=10141 RepID=UPI002FE0650D